MKTKKDIQVLVAGVKAMFAESGMLLRRNELFPSACEEMDNEIINMVMNKMGLDTLTAESVLCSSLGVMNMDEFNQVRKDFYSMF